MSMAAPGTKIPAKTCSCGVTYVALPAPGIFNDNGLWFTCPHCFTTLLIGYKNGVEPPISRREKE